MRHREEREREREGGRHGDPSSEGLVRAGDGEMGIVTEESGDTRRRGAEHPDKSPSQRII